MTEFNNYLSILTKALVNVTNVNINLNSFKSQYCKCPSNFSAKTISNFSILANPVQAIEQPLVNLESSIISAANSALTNANAAVITLNSPVQWLVINVNRTKLFLTNLLTTNSFYNIAWNSISACNDLRVRAGLVLNKYRQYTQAYYASNQNRSMIYSLQTTLNATVPYYKLNLSQATTIGALIGTLKVLQPLTTNYTSQLSISSGKMMEVWRQIMTIGDTYCSCASLASTTTTILESTKITVKIVKQSG
ncbi:hypothetical protein PVAND_015110 [Polypedilum vanderplanki]|uniref:Uncharacterized protein n=1 Tax=Polypedilum vanderplanki TaxID=319348 RepID=A0A9J6BBQ9_POLVA|nr:hypothetical protein PVAND_015110 [Polypedilum vanderplanki]